MSERSIKKKIIKLLESGNPDHILAELEKIPARETLHGLFSGICHGNETIRWHAVIAMGTMVAKVAAADLEAGRIVMRRFMWSLNDESGGIGWGAPEAMAEVLCHSDVLAEEFSHILVSFMREDGFYIDHVPLQRGLMWGIGRYAQVRPQKLIKLNAPQYLMPFLESSDPIVKGLAAWSAGILGMKQATTLLEAMLGDSREVPYLLDRKISSAQVQELAKEALLNVTVHCK